MFLTGVVITGGTLVAGAKVYREKQREKNTPWTVAAERLEKRRKKRNVPASRALLGSITTFRDESISRFFPQGTLAGTDTRREQRLALSSSDDEAEISEAEKKVDRYLAYSTFSLAVSTTGTLFYAPLALLSVPVLSYLSYVNIRTALQTGFADKRVGVALIDLVSTVGPLVTGHFFASSLVFGLYFLSRKLLIKTEDHSRHSLINVFGEQPSFVWIESDEVEVQVPFEQVQIGDVVLVGAGQTVPVDGTIIRGHGRIDQRMLTGESQPVEKGMGDSAFASTIVLEGKIGIQVEKAGASTVAAQIGEILNSTADFKSSVQARGETIIDQGATPTLALSVLALPLLGVQSALAVLYAAFGYQMRIAAPLSVLNFLRIASEKGVLIKDGRSLELLSTVDTFVFDKTGTLTKEVPTVGTIYTCHGYDENEVLAIAAAAEEKQSHPIAFAIRQEADERNLIVPAMSDARYDVGYGLKVSIKEQLIRVGSGRFIEMESITIPAHIKQIEESAHAEGHSLVYVAIDKQLAGAISLKPTIRPEAKSIVSALKQRNMSIVIISGDHHGPTKKLAQELGIECYFAEVLPQDKASLVEQLQQEGQSVCFVGDGINDSIALKKANVSISLRGASTVATDSASIILMDETLNKLIPLLDIAQNLDRNLKQSTVMTVVPGLICVGGVFFFHFGLVSSIVLYNMALMSSVSNAMWPLFKHNRDKLIASE
ncbi:MAG: heavy metal translocating P-type ATPase [Ardenticatenaceae bacterium]